MENGNNANTNIAVLEQTSNKNNDISAGTSASIPNGQPSENAPTEGKLFNLYQKQWTSFKMIAYNNTLGMLQLDKY